VIFVVFLLPLGVYLLVLAHINRQPRPVFVSGTWDFVGILFAASGFLLFGGPAVLSAVSENWRMFWLLGDTAAARASLLGQWSFWLTLSVVYFVLVVGGSAVILLRQRPLTSIYNVEPDLVEGALEEVCQQLGLAPIRSGGLFVFGLTLEQLDVGPDAPGGIQAPHALPYLAPQAEARPVERPAGPGEELVGQSAVLEVEPFGLLRHVTLRWEPHDSPLRPVIEAELRRRLVALGAPYHDTAVVLTLIAYGVLGLALFIGFVLVLRLFLLR
jgi:hypothetical protein